MWHPRTKALLLCAAIVVLYNDWFLESFLNSHISSRYSLISELSARTQPYHWAFQTLDIVAGVMILMVLPWLWRFLRKFDFSYSLLLFITIASLGADNIADALMPISCAPSVDLNCSLLGTHSLLTEAHLVESTAIGMVTFVAPLLWWWSSRASHALIARASLWFVVLQVFVGGGILLTRAVDFNVVGIFQRMYVLGIGLWIAGILQIALAATAKQRIALPSLQPSPDPAPQPTLVVSIDE
jgi:hypothetical protein